jgi:MFS family permease
MSSVADLVEEPQRAELLPAKAVDRAVRLSCAQAMLGSIYAASTGGMFIIGYALKLGADNLQIGLMNTLPMLCVVMQLVSAGLVEGGVSRRKLTVWAALANVSGWGLIILIPYALGEQPQWVRMAALIGTITLVTALGNLANNARGSWVGDLIPESQRGHFFGRMTMYGGLIGTAFALIEGVFLDEVNNRGIGAFSVLFGFGMVFGLLNVILFVPQADVPVAPVERGPGLWRMAADTFRNKPLMVLMAFWTLWCLQSMAGPFYPTYMLRDLGMPFLGVGLINAAVMLTMLLSSPFWGRMVNRHGCRPVLVACGAIIGPMPLVWYWMTDALRVYIVIGGINLVVGFAIGGVVVAIQTLIYKVTPQRGRSVQLAVYAIVVTLVAAPMPVLGGQLPDLLGKLGLPNDLRTTFMATSLFIFAAVLVARFIREPGATRTRDMVRSLPGYFWGQVG